MRTLLFTLALWMLVVTVVGLSDIYSLAPPQAIGITIVTATITILLLHWRIEALRLAISKLPIGFLLLVNVIRAPVGASFIIAFDYGEFPQTFALRAGWGDIAVAVAALVLAYVMSWHQISTSERVLLTVWNSLGLLDLIFAVGTALYHAFTQDGSMNTMARLPFLFVPTMILPWLFAIHAYIFYRIAERQGEHNSS